MGPEWSFSKWSKQSHTKSPRAFIARVGCQETTGSWNFFHRLISVLLQSRYGAADQKVFRFSQSRLLLTAG